MVPDLQKLIESQNQHFQEVVVQIEKTDEVKNLVATKLNVSVNDVRVERFRYRTYRVSVNEKGYVVKTNSKSTEIITFLQK